MTEARGKRAVPDDQLFKFLDNTTQKLQVLANLVQSRTKLICKGGSESECAKLDVELSEMSHLFKDLRGEQSNMNWQFAEAYASLHPST